MASSRFACIHCFLVLIWTAGSVFPFFCLYAFALWMSAWSCVAPIEPRTRRPHCQTVGIGFASLLSENRVCG
jgi:hypothetical protein